MFVAPVAAAKEQIEWEEKVKAVVSAAGEWRDLVDEGLELLKQCTSQPGLHIPMAVALHASCKQEYDLLLCLVNSTQQVVRDRGEEGPDMMA